MSSSIRVCLPLFTMASPAENVKALQEITIHIGNIPASPNSQPQDKSSVTQEYFLRFSVADLKTYLGERKLKVEGTKKELATLAYWAWKLNLPKNPSGKFCLKLF